jgi:N-methylhydantoinase A/oxoprolinase/acetone carboxylase beta subunit
LEVVSLKVEASGPPPEQFATGMALGVDVENALKASRPAYFPSRGGLVDCPVYARERLAPGVTIDGPALIEEAESTCLLDNGDRARVDEHYNLIGEIGVAA